MMSVRLAASLLIGMGAVFLLHVGLWRLRPAGSPRIPVLALLGTVGTAASAALYGALSSWDPVGASAALWYGFSLTIAYLFFYAGVSRSVSLSLLIQIAHQGRSSASFGEVLAGFAESDRFEGRVRLMREAGLVSLEGGEVRLTPKGRRWGGTARALGNIFGSGLEG